MAAAEVEEMRKAARRLFWQAKQIEQSRPDDDEAYRAGYWHGREDGLEWLEDVATAHDLKPVHLSDDEWRNLQEAARHLALAYANCLEKDKRDN